MKTAVGIALVMTLAGCGSPSVSAPPVLEQHVEQTPEGRYLVISLREPVSPEQVQAAIDAHKTSIVLVRAFTYKEGGAPGKSKPDALYQWTALDGLKKVY